MNFTGVECAACGKVFDEEDDIVVCPECGTPHHRSCYLAENKCANAHLHAEGFIWERTVPEPEPTVNTEEKHAHLCAYCGQENQPGEIFCARCGNRLEEDDENGEMFREWNGADVQDIFSDPYLGFDPKEDMGGASLEEVTDFIGSNRIYYLPLFKRMKESGTKISFNLMCFFLAPFHFASRRMWLWAVLSALVLVLLGLPAALSFIVSDSVNAGYQVFPAKLTDFIYNNRDTLNLLVNVCSIIELIIRTALCLFGNWLYFRHALRSIRQLKKAGLASKSNVAAIGGFKPLNILLMLVIFAAFAFIGLYGTLIGVDLIYMLIVGV